MAKIFGGGLPTEIEVHRLMETYQVPSEGLEIPYDEVSALIACAVRTCRFRTVTSAWRSRLAREHNVYLSARDQRFTVLAPGQRIDLGSAKLRSGLRSARRAHVIVSSTDRARLTSAEQAQSDHVQHVSASIVMQARVEARKKASLLAAMPS